jgi:hypothetical protein
MVVADQKSEARFVPIYLYDETRPYTCGLLGELNKVEFSFNSQLGKFILYRPASLCNADPNRSFHIPGYCAAPQIGQFHQVSLSNLREMLKEANYSGIESSKFPSNQPVA